MTNGNAHPDKWKRFADHEKWQRRRATIFAFLKTHTVAETAKHFGVSRALIYQMIAKRKRNAKYGSER